MADPVRHTGLKGATVGGFSDGSLRVVKRSSSASTTAPASRALGV